MSRHNIFADKNVVCPFYKWQDNQKICCEGIVDNSTLHLAFASPADRLKQVVKHCNSMDRYPTCPVAKMLNEMYEQEGE